MKQREILARSTAPRLMVNKLIVYVSCVFVYSVFCLRDRQALAVCFEILSNNFCRGTDKPKAG